jgi:flagellin-like hook-associated protein FlgL
MDTTGGTLGVGPGLGANRLGQVQKQQAGVLQQAASGVRINRGADDPAGLISSENLRAVLAELEAESRSLDRTRQAAAVVDGSLGAIGDLIIEAEALAVANASGGGLSDAEREANQMEINSILQSVDRLAQRTSFADASLLRGGASLRAGNDEVPIASAAATDLGETEIDGKTYRLSDVASGGSLDTTREGGSRDAIEVLREARDEILRSRGDIGSFVQNTVEPRFASLSVAIENTASAESSIRDTDYAEAAAELNRLNLLENASLTAATVGPFDPTRILTLLG